MRRGSVKRFTNYFDAVARLRKPAVDAGRVQKLEREVERIVDAIAGGLSSAALRKRLAATEVELEQARAASRVIDVKAVMQAIPAALERYRKLAGSLSSNTPGLSIEAGREIIRNVAGQVPVKPGTDGVPVAMLALNPVQLAAASGSDIGMVAGACYGLVQYSRFSPPSTSAGPLCRQAAAETATNSHPTTLCPRSGAPAGAAANAEPIVPLPGVANGRPRLSAQVICGGVPRYARGWGNGKICLEVIYSELLRAMQVPARLCVGRKRVHGHAWYHAPQLQGIRAVTD